MNGHSEDYSEQCEIKENGQVETNGIKIWRLVLTGMNRTYCFPTTFEKYLTDWLNCPGGGESDPTIQNTNYVLHYIKPKSKVQ